MSYKYRFVAVIAYLQQGSSTSVLSRAHLKFLDMFVGATPNTYIEFYPGASCAHCINVHNPSVEKQCSVG